MFTIVVQWFLMVLEWLLDRFIKDVAYMGNVLFCRTI